MRQKSIMDNLNYKTQSHERVCKGNKLGKYNCVLNIFVERLIVRYHPSNTEEIDFSALTCVDASQHKGTNNVLYQYNNVCNSLVLDSAGERSANIRDQASS